MSNPRELYNTYHKALMDARIEATKQMQKSAVKKYEIDARAKAYSDKNAVDREKIKAENNRSYYKTFVDAMGKASEFDSKNPLHQIRKEGDVFYKGVGEAEEEISGKAYAQYLTENKNTMKLRNLVMGGYLNGIKYFSEYDEDAIARAEIALKRNPNNPPSGVTYGEDGRVLITDKNTGNKKDIKEKTDEELSDPDLNLEGEDDGSWFTRGTEDTIYGKGKGTPVADQFLSPIVNSFIPFDEKGKPVEEAPADFNSQGLAETSASTTGVSPDAGGKMRTQEEGLNLIMGKGGFNVGSNVSNSAGLNTSLSDKYTDALNKKLNKK
jgi:hypothetical protein